MANTLIRNWKILPSLKSIGNDLKYALVYLNGPIRQNLITYMKSNWDKAQIKIAVDGAVNRLHTENEMAEQDSWLIPDYITGDFDSIQPKLLELYKGKGSKTKHTPDQDHTDFTKAIVFLLEQLEHQKKEVDYIVVVTDMSGRLDHLMSCFNTLFTSLNKTNTPIVMIGSENICWLLDKGKHKIYVDSSYDKKNVGLIPLGEPCQSVSTTGLKWNLNNGCLKFGELISTSNTYESLEEVTIDTDKPLLWISEIDLV